MTPPHQPMSIESTMEAIEPRFSSFHDLMAYRIREILLVSSPYDAFVLEEDGRLSDKIFSEYLDMNLQFVPRITRVSSAEEAFASLSHRTYDLVITMTRIADADPLDFGRRVKALYPHILVVLLTYEAIPPQELKRIRAAEGVDKVFCWMGNNKLLLTIIKFAEDLGNVKADARQGVQIILVVEDSPWHYSILLPLLYTELMKQTRYLISHAVNDLHRLLRMRARPKILLAETSEQATSVFQTYRHNLLGIITDVSFLRGGRPDPLAGAELAKWAKAEIPDLPILLQSNEKENESIARELGIPFLDKNSPRMTTDVHDFILNQLGFGDFIFRFPDGGPCGKAANLSQFERMIKTMPDEVLRYHASRNHFSIWLRARTEFELADEIRPKRVSDFKDTQEIRVFILDAIARLFTRIQSGVVTDFGRSKIDARNSFIRIGNGSLGGKGRGIAFINALLSQKDTFTGYGGVEVLTPHSFILCSEVFEEFMELGNLQGLVSGDLSDPEIAQHFLAAPLPARIEGDLQQFVDRVTYPLAVRSSSILEDSQLMPFAGLYRTYMLPNNHPDPQVRLLQLTRAIRLVYASVFYRLPKEYLRNTRMRVEEERMAVLIQQVVGEVHGDLYYPAISGVAQSYNFYPFPGLDAAEGIASLALGLGRSITDGERVFRFSPGQPDKNPPYSSAAEMVQESQSHFYALEMAHPDPALSEDDRCCYHRCDLSRAEADGVLGLIAGSYSPEDEVMHETLQASGPRVVHFGPVLKLRTVPLAAIIQDFLALGQRAFASHVEIEFAVNLFTRADGPPEFYFLQIRPMVVGREMDEVDVEEARPAELLCRCRHALGNGVFRDIHDLLYIEPDEFARERTRQIADEIGEMNRRLLSEDRAYALIGFGRFGTTDPWLGIPVEWTQISNAEVIVEADQKGFEVEPSQGSHFFHNMVSRNLGYFHVGLHDPGEFIDWGYLAAQPAFTRGRFIRHLRFPKPLVVRIDGRKSSGLILRPGCPGS